MSSNNSWKRVLGYRNGNSKSNLSTKLAHRLTAVSESAGNVHSSRKSAQRALLKQAWRQALSEKSDEWSRAREKTPPGYRPPTFPAYRPTTTQQTAAYRPTSRPTHTPASYTNAELAEIHAKAAAKKNALRRAAAARGNAIRAQKAALRAAAAKK